MATATAGAQVGLRFDIVADATQFRSAVAESQQQWRSATEDMRQRSGGVGEGFTSGIGKVLDTIGDIAVELNTALNGGAAGVEKATLAGFEKIQGFAAKLIDDAASFGEKWGGKFGGRAASAVASIVKEGIEPAFKTSLGALDAFTTTDLFKSLQAGAETAAGQFDQLSGNVAGLEDKLKGATEGFKNAIDVAKGVRVAAGDFEAVLEPLDKQIQKHERAVELVGKTTAEVVKLRAEWALADSDVDPERFAADQTAKYQAKLEEAAKAAAAEEGAKKAEEQRKAFEGITANLDRQVELVKARRLEHEKTTGIVAQERAVIEANYRMQARGRELSEEETRAIRDKAVALGAYTDMLARESAQRTALNGIARQAENTRIEAQTLGMSAGAAAAYKVELQALERFKEQNISVSEEFRQRLHAEAEAYGRNVQGIEQMRASMRLVADVGGAAMRSLESVFDSFIEGRKVKWKDMVDSLLKDLMRLSFRAALQPIFGGGQGQGFGMIGSAIAGLFAAGAGGGVGSWETTSIPARAGGGPVSAGMPYRVGERGEELFVPNTSGHIVPNHALGQGGGTTVNIINNHAGARISSRETDDGRGNRQTHVVIEEMVATGLAGAGGQQAMRGYGARPNLAAR